LKEPAAYRARAAGGEPVDPVIEKRINALGTVEPRSSAKAASAFSFQVPGFEDRSGSRTIITGGSKLEFRRVDEA